MDLKNRDEKRCKACKSSLASNSTWQKFEVNLGKSVGLPWGENY